MKTTYSAILFDLDGTLLDTLDDLYAAVNFVLQKHGLPLRSRDEVRAFIGNGIVKLMERSVGAGARSRVDMTAVVEDFKAYYGTHCQEKTKPYDGVLALLSQLKADVRRVGVVSNKAHFAVEKLCSAYFGDLVDVAIGENEASGVRKKPAPDTLLEALRRLGAEKENAVYVGDSEVDIQTAENAGVECISVSWGMKDSAFLTENGAETIVECVGDLGELLMAIPTR